MTIAEYKGKLKGNEGNVYIRIDVNRQIEWDMQCGVFLLQMHYAVLEKALPLSLQTSKGESCWNKEDMI